MLKGYVLRLNDEIISKPGRPHIQRSGGVAGLTGCTEAKMRDDLDLNIVLEIVDSRVL